MIAPVKSFIKTHQPSRRLDAPADVDRETAASADMPTKLKQAATSLIVGQPVTALAVAATAGLLLGWLVKRNWNS